MSGLHPYEGTATGKQHWHGQICQTASLISPSQPDPIVATSSYTSTEPQVSGSVSSSQNNPPYTAQMSTTRTHDLAQPVGPNWVRNKQSADADQDQKINNIKARQSQMDEAVK